MTPTARGWAVAVAGVLSLAAAALFGIEELYVVAAGLAALLAFGALWIAASRFDLASRRRLQPVRIGAGESALVELFLTNRSRRSSPLLSIRELSESSGEPQAFRVAPVRPGQTVSATYRLPPNRRGRYLVGPLQLTLSDPFDLVRRTRAGAAASPLTVHPDLARLAAAPTAAGLDRFGAGQGHPMPGGEEFSSLRPYREGDDLRRVHWPSTARLDRVMVRQTDAISDPRCTVALDLRTGSWQPDLLEEALAAAGGILDAARRTGIEIRLLATPVNGTSTLDTGFGATVAHWTRVLDALAVAQAGNPPTGPGSGTAGLAALLRSAERAAAGSAEDTLTVITSAQASDADLAGLARLAPAASLIVVVFGPPRADRTEPAPVPGGCVRVERPGGFPRAWAQLSSQRRTARLVPR